MGLLWSSTKIHNNPILSLLTMFSSTILTREYSRHLGAFLGPDFSQLLRGRIESDWGRKICQTRWSRQLRQISQFPSFRKSLPYIFCFYLRHVVYSKTKSCVIHYHITLYPWGLFTGDLPLPFTKSVWVI